MIRTLRSREAITPMSKRAGSQTVEVNGSHAVYVSQPEAVADLIAGAARGARGWLVGAHGGITQGPVGDLENRFVSSW